MHLGTYMFAADAAVAYDRAARRFREPGCALNFNADLYEDDWFLQAHAALDEDAYIMQLREYAYALLNRSRWCANNNTRTLQHTTGTRSWMSSACRSFPPCTSGRSTTAS